ncbi:MAG: UDP-N-acetylglucosamine 1-carboxyvinyltransferase [Lachnospirales bacterium]
MEKFLIEGMKSLEGTVKISGSKNAVLPVMAAMFLCGEECEITNPPRLSDVYDMIELMKYYGAKISFNNTLKINCENIIPKEPNDTAQKIRASFLLAGGLLGRFKRADMAMPGGCLIGQRPVDLHLKGFAGLGANFNIDMGIIHIVSDNLIGGDIYLDFPSVGATENIMISSVLAEGKTTINNCAIEPEIVCLAEFLNKMGANIKGAGTETIVIYGVKNLKGVSFEVIPDRIEAGTFMLAVAAAGGKCRIENVICDHLKPVILKLKEIGVEIYENKNYIDISSYKRLPNTDIKTMPYPGFPTDMQAQFTSAMTVGIGTGIVNETIFENRFMYINELKKMGADITLEGRSAVVKGVERLKGAKVLSTDLRAGAALVISALCAEGQTEIGNINYIDRGYDHLEKKLELLGANIIRTECE